MLSLVATAFVACCAQQGGEHWAYQRPVRAAAPAVEGATTPIDGLLAAKWAGAGLVPTDIADRAALARRASLDVIGLPPTVDELEAFLGDRDPGAYERFVDRLLASPHYGERWAAPWLDLARYGDTNGYNFDGGRSIWPYRDWLIEALNADMPFDRFTIEQLAGDLLPDADEATPSMRNKKSGSWIPRKDRAIFSPRILAEPI